VSEESTVWVKTHTHFLILQVLQLTAPDQASECREDIPWKMRVIAVYDDEREEVKTYVSTYDMQGQSIKTN